MKICTFCHVYKENNEFYLDKSKKDGLSSRCKVCANQQSKIWNKNNKEKRRLNSLKYSRKSVVQIREKLRRNQYKNEKREYDRIYRKANKKHILEREYIYRTKRLKEFPELKILKNIRKRIWDALRGNSKSVATKKLIGCSIEELKQWIESKFQDGMSWDNYGFYGWHIDHIKPLSLFDLTDKVQFLKACHYTNLQPMWWRENFRKGSKTFVGPLRWPTKIFHKILMCGYG